MKKKTTLPAPAQPQPQIAPPSAALPTGREDPLDEALEETFPASDPISVARSIPVERPERLGR